MTFERRSMNRSAKLTLWMRLNMALCGAKKRGNGEPCKRHAIPGSSRCKLHGGKGSGAPKGSKNAAKPGSIYSQFLTDAENGMLASIELGRVDDELRLTRIRLMRALGRENEFGNELEVDSEKVETGESGGTTTTSKVRDYSSLIDRLTGRIESLERTRAELLKTNPPELPPVTRIEIEVVGGRKDASGANDAAAG